MGIYRRKFLENTRAWVGFGGDVPGFELAGSKCVFLLGDSLLLKYKKDPFLETEVFQQCWAATSKKRVWRRP